jgi:PTS system nitrogen regulatory IIA component
MRIPELLSPERIACQRACSSKKRSLELLSKLLADALPEFTDGEIFDSLIGRERLGSTGLGNGVALPHGRINGLREPMAALVVLSDGIDFDAIDSKPVDLLFALLVPQESTDEHLKILARLAEMFSDKQFCSELRHCENNEQCYKLIENWNSRQQLYA